MIEDVLPAFRFLVTLQPGDAYLPPAQAALLPLVAGGEFMEVKGLGADLEVTAYAEGGLNDHLHQLPVRHSWTRISLRRGVVRDRGLWSWYVAGLTQSLGARRDGSVIMLTAAGTPAMSWTFQAGLAAKWVGPELNAMQSAVAVESLEIAHHGLVSVLLSPPGPS
ncbi:phage tail protein [Paraburkholderia sp. BR14374]|uniref:phage tail protein n=1 Tax=Paraburkholderia sp. BR14374 TaxID=3237007 RepID=UPI0034CFC91C